MINSKSKVNGIYPSFAKQLGFPIKLIDVGVQKIDSIILDTYGMVVAAFSVVDKANRIRFFKKTFLVANVGLKVVFGILFLTLSNADIDFSVWELWWKTYITKKTFLTTKCIELVRKKKFAAAALDPKYEIYVIYVAFLSFTPLVASLRSTLLNIHSFQKPQIFGLIVKEAPIKVFDKYANFANVFSLDLVSKLLEYTEINNHAIKLVDSQQPPYRPI